MERVDEAARTAVMAARGTDRRGQGGATATIASTVRDDGGTTTVDVATDFAITGRLARFGRGGMIEDVSRRLLGEFATCLQARLQAPPAADAPDAATTAAEPSPPVRPLDAGRLGRQAVAERLRAWWARLGRWLRARGRTR